MTYTFTVKLNRHAKFLIECRVVQKCIRPHKHNTIRTHYQTALPEALTSSGSTQAPRGCWAQALQIVARPPNLAVLMTHCGQLLLREISKFDASRCQILRLKCTKFDFRKLSVYGLYGAMLRIRGTTAMGLCLCLCPSVCPSVCHKSVFY